MKQLFTFWEGAAFNVTLALTLLTQALAMFDLKLSLITVGMIVIALTLEWRNNIAYSELFPATGILRQHRNYRSATRFEDINLSDYRFIQLEYGIKYRYVQYVYLTISGQFGQKTVSTFGLGKKYLDKNGQLIIPPEAKELKTLFIKKYRLRDLGPY